MTSPVIHRAASEVRTRRGADVLGYADPTEGDLGGDRVFAVAIGKPSARVPPVLVAASQTAALSRVRPARPDRAAAESETEGESGTEATECRVVAVTVRLCDLDPEDQTRSGPADNPAPSLLRAALGGSSLSLGSSSSRSRRLNFGQLRSDRYSAPSSRTHGCQP